MVLTGENRPTRRRKAVPLPLCLPQVSHGLTWDRKQVYGVKGFWIISVSLIFKIHFVPRSEHSISGLQILIS
jgi:hypothetical protein